MNKMLQHIARKNKYSRVIEPYARSSTAQRTVASAAPVSVSFTQPKMDPDEIRRVSARVLNMQHLITHIFDGSLARMALHTEMAPDRLRSLMEMHIPFGSEIAEHLEKCMNLPGGWLDNKRSTIDADHLREIIFASNAHHAPAPGSGKSDEEFAGDGDHHAGAISHPADAVKIEQDHATMHTAEAAKSALAEDKPTVPAVGSADTIVEDTNVDQTKDGSASDLKSDQGVHDMGSGTENPKQATIDKSTDYGKGNKAETKQVEPKRLDDPVTQTLIWLNHELGRYRSSTGGPVRPEIAEIMDRAPSTLSTWLTGVRKMPSEMLVPLVLAIHKIRLPLANEFQERMRIAAPAAMSYMPEIAKSKVTPVGGAPAPAPVVTPTLTSAAAGALTDMTATSTQVDSHQGGASPDDHGVPHAAQYAAQGVTQEMTPHLGPSNNTEFKLTIARAADRVASVLQRLMER